MEIVHVYIIPVLPIIHGAANLVLALGNLIELKKERAEHILHLILQIREGHQAGVIVQAVLVREAQAGVIVQAVQALVHRAVGTVQVVQVQVRDRVARVQEVPVVLVRGVRVVPDAEDN